MTRRLPFLPVALAFLLGSCAAGTPERAADRGIGGTGIHTADRGIGGTGIVGTVTAFGSIWVNGMEVEVPPAAAVRVEGRPAAPGAVRIGHVVALTATPAPKGADGIASDVEVRFAVAGPVEAVGEGALTVLGQRVDLGEALLAAEPRPGLWVAVSGLRRPDGRIAAGRVEPWDFARGWLLRGTSADAAAGTAAASGAPGTLTLAGFTARLAPGVAAPAPGQPVRAAGRLGPDGAVATDVAPDPLNPFGAAVRALSVELYADPSQSGAPPGAHSPDGRIVVEGPVDAAGALRPGRSAAAPGIGRTGAPGIGHSGGPNGDGQNPGGQNPAGPNTGGPNTGAPGVGGHNAGNPGAGHQGPGASSPGAPGPAGGGGRGGSRGPGGGGPGGGGRGR